MVRAILDGSKTQTRREVKPQPEYVNMIGVPFYPNGKGPVDYRLSPYGQTGDRLWVRESGWQPPRVSPKMLQEGADTWPPYIYDADGDDSNWCRDHGWKRRPSIHMPRWASRVTLEVTDVRVERLQEITGADAMAEGIRLVHFDAQGMDVGYEWHSNEDAEDTPRTAFKCLWESINGPGSWAANPWVWAVKFQRIKP